MINFVRLPLKNVYNARDLGGYPTEDGQITQYRKFVRSDNLTKLDETDKDLLLKYGVKAVIDLRGPAELREAPNPFQNNPLVNFLNVPLITGERGELHIAERYKDIDENYLTNSYLDIVQNSTKQIKEIFNFIANQESGVLFHCAAGKDRTGILAMLLLGLVGVKRSDIITNYMMTEVYISENPSMQNFSDKLPYTVPAELLQSKPEFLNPTIDFINNEFSSYENYLLSLGLTNDLLHQVKKDFVTPINIG